MRIPQLNANITKIPPYGKWWIFEAYKDCLDYHYCINAQNVLTLIPCLDPPSCKWYSDFIPKWWMAL